MRRRNFNHYLGTALVAPSIVSLQAAAAAPIAWSFVADVAESCSCEIPCPCNFGQPTKDRCDGSRLIQIREGTVGGADLSGVGFVATFEMREWSKLYVDDAMDAAQRQAFDRILPLAFGGFKKIMRTLEYVTLEVARADARVRFSVPASTVEIELMRGIDGGPITISGLPSPAFYDYTQYKSIVHTHKGTDREWSYQGTNGFTSVMRVSGQA